MFTLHMDKTAITTGNCTSPAPRKPEISTMLKVRPGSKNASIINTSAPKEIIASSAVKMRINSVRPTNNPKPSTQAAPKAMRKLRMPTRAASSKRPAPTNWPIIMTLAWPIAKEKRKAILMTDQA